MQKNIIIIGTGGFGREVIGYVRDVIQTDSSWHFSGFLDVNPQALEDAAKFGDVLGSPDTYAPKEADMFVCAIADPRTKVGTCAQLRARGARFSTLIHPTAIVSPHCVLGTGVIIAPYCTISPDVRIDDDVSINSHCAIGHDAIIEKGCTLSSFVSVNGHVHIEEGVFIGSHGTVTPRIRVGAYATVGAGSVVVSRVEPGHTVFGVPATTLFTPEDEPR